MDELAALYAAHPLWSWLAVAAALLAVEVLTGTGWLLWPAASAAAAGAIARVAGLDLAPTLAVFAVLTLASSLISRRFARQPAVQASGDINDNMARLIGQRGYSAQAFRDGRGRVSIDGKEWAAEAMGDAPLAKGDSVEVVAVAPGRLQVRAT